jgi:DMSO/TMAO reductase YedYZ molybdopterin-dependent catalytic subunit
MTTTSADTPAHATTPSRDRLRTLAGPALAGAIAAGVSIAISELIAGLIAGAPSLVVAIGQLVIDLQPKGAKDLVVSLFGTNDKLALTLLIVIVALVIACAVGVAGDRDIRRADVGFGVFGLVALYAASRLPLVTLPLAIITTLLAVGGGLWAIRFLYERLRIAEPTPPQRSASSRSARGAFAAAGTSAADAKRLRRLGLAAPDAGSGMPTWDRRSFLIGSASLAGAAVVAGGAGRYLLQSRAAAAPPVAAIPKPAITVAPLTPAESISVPGITPLVVPNGNFYRIDTALIPPRVAAATWKLTVKGMVDHVVTLDYNEITTLPLFEQYVTIQCVSNVVGGNLVGNTLWTGVHLRDVLAMAGVQAGATQIVGRSVDGFTAGFPTEWAMDPSRDPMIALEMNREALPIEHGYPARLIVPGLYGYVSATKWLTEIELTTLEAFDGYWVPLGWSKLGPILTQSRIDVPGYGATIPAGDTVIAGVAWAPDRGVSRVEVSIDGGTWQPCTLSQAISKATWLQWELRCAATSGQHTIAVRATDGTGVVQTADLSEQAPDGARGHHTIPVNVS